jgi:amino acid transporter
MGRIIGTGIFSTPSSIISSTGSVGAALLTWVLGFAISMAGMFVWLEFSCMFPRSGGEKVYLEAAYRRPKLFITTIYAVWSVFLGFTATGAISFANYMWVAADEVATDWQKRGVAVCAVAAVCLMHALIPRVGVRIMNAVAAIKIFLLLFIVVSGWAVLGGAVSTDKIPDPHASFEDSFAGSASSGNPYATALFKVLQSFAGWQNAAYVLNEVKRPVHTIRIAGPLALFLCGTMYMLINVAYFAAATPDEIAARGITVGAFFMGKVFNHAAERAFSLLIAISAIGNVMTVTFAHARVLQELAKEGVIPFNKFWASTWPANAPSSALLLHFIPSFIMIICVPSGDAYNFIVNVEGYARAILFFAVVTGLFILRWKKPMAHRPLRVWWPVSIAFLVGQAFLLVAPFLRPPGGKGDTSIVYWAYSLVGIGVCFFGALYWLFWKQIMPRALGYTLEEDKIVIKDGTFVTRFYKVKS